MEDCVDGEFSSILASPLDPRSLDYFVRPRQHVRRSRQADLFGGLEIDHKFKFRRLFDGKIRRFLSLQDFVHQCGRTVRQVFSTSSVVTPLGIDRQ
jgi:hypothetical protein